MRIGHYTFSEATQLHGNIKSDKSSNKKTVNRRTGSFEMLLKLQRYIICNIYRCSLTYQNELAVKTILLLQNMQPNHAFQTCLN